MKDTIELAPNLELVVIGAGRLGFNKADEPLRELVKLTFREVQVPVLKEHSESIGDKALRPVDSIGIPSERGMLTDQNDRQPGYNHIILVLRGSEGTPKPIGMRVTDEIRVPNFGNVLMEYYAGMVPAAYASCKYEVDINRLLKPVPPLKALPPLKLEMTPHQILLAFNKHLTKLPDKFVATITDGVGIDKRVLAEGVYEHYGPIGQTMLWTPPLNAEKKEQYGVAMPMELYVKFGSGVSDHRFPEKAALFIAIDKYIKEGTAELNARRLKRAGYTFDTLPSVVKTREAHAEVAAANSGYIPCSPLRV